MKKLLITAFIGSVLTGCSDKKAQKEAALDGVIQVHNKVMSADEHLMKNKMALDTLITKDSSAAKDTAILLRAKLAAADSSMEIWMHKFDPDYKGKTDDETLNYLNDQKKQVTAIDSQINAAIKQSDTYLQKVKK
jgi:hypothetical protein